MSNVQTFNQGGSGPIPPGTVTELDGNTGAATPSAGVINVIGVGSLLDGFSTNGNIITFASGNNLTVYETKAQYVTDLNSITFSDTPYTAIATDYYISVDATGGAISVLLPDSPGFGRMFLVKDSAGISFTNNITISTPGGTTTMDGNTSYVLDTNYEAVLFTFNGTSYEAF